MEMCVEAVLLELRLGWPLCIRKTQFPLYLVEGQKDGKNDEKLIFSETRHFFLPCAHLRSLFSCGRHPTKIRAPEEKHCLCSQYCDHSK